MLEELEAMGPIAVMIAGPVIAAVGGLLPDPYGLRAIFIGSCLFIGGIVHILFKDPS